MSYDKCLSDILMLTQKLRRQRWLALNPGRGQREPIHFFTTPEEYSRTHWGIYARVAYADGDDMEEFFRECSRLFT
jgi:hypothetical protein